MIDSISVSEFSEDFSIIDDYDSKESLANVPTNKLMQSKGANGKVVDFGKVDPMLGCFEMQVMPDKLDAVLSAQRKIHSLVMIKVKKLKQELRLATSQRNELDKLANSYRDSLNTSQDSLKALRCSLEIQQARSQSAEQQVTILEGQLRKLQGKSILLEHNSATGASCSGNVDDESEQSCETLKASDVREMPDETIILKSVDSALIEEPNYGLFRSRLLHLEAQFSELQRENSSLKADLKGLTAKLAETEEECVELRKQHLYNVEQREIANSQLALDDMGETSTNLLSITQSDSERAVLDGDTTCKKKHLMSTSMKQTELQAAYEGQMIAYLRTVHLRIDKLIQDGKKTVVLPADKLIHLFNDSLEMLQRLTIQRDKYSKGFSNAQRHRDDLERNCEKLEQKIRQVVKEQRIKEKTIDEKNERMAEMQAKLNQYREDLESLKAQFNISGDNLQRTLKQRNYYHAEAKSLRSAALPLLEVLQRNEVASNLLKPGELEKFQRTLGADYKQRQSDLATGPSAQAGVNKASAAKVPKVNNPSENNSTTTTRPGTAAATATNSASSGLRGAGALPATDDVHRKYVAPSSNKLRVSKQ